MGTRAFGEVVSRLFLSQKLGGDLPGDVGQAEVAALEAKSQLGVLEAEKMQDRRLDVMDVNAVADRGESEFIGLAHCHARLHASAGHPHRHGVDVMVAADRLANLAHRRAPEFAAPDDERVSRAGLATSSP